MDPRYGDIIQEIRDVRSEYGPGASLVPALHVAQRRFGWLSAEALSLVADTLSIPEAKVRGVASFYSMFRLAPVGRHVIQLCTNVACMIMGSGQLLDLLRNRYGLEPDGTTQDGRFSLVVMECIGACGASPAMLVDDSLHDNLTADTVIEILEGYR